MISLDNYQSPQNMEILCETKTVSVDTATWPLSAE